MSNKTDSSGKNNGVGFLGLLTLAFIVLKLMGYIDWSWWLVLSPMLAAFALIIAIFGIAVLLGSSKS